MTSRAHQTASAQRPSSTHDIERGMMVRRTHDTTWFQVTAVLDAFYLRVEDLLTGEKKRLCVWDVDRWG